MLHFFIRQSLFITLFTITSQYLSAQISFGVTSGKNRDFTLAFYNVENLYDTINDPLIDDDEFLPGTKKDWTSARYQDKLSKLAKVISGIGGSMPDIVGLCEIENGGVLKDLTQQNVLKGGNYKIVHYDSPDQRGIDVALLYSANLMTLINSEAIKIEMPPEERPTRDILYAQMQVKKHGLIHVFVNHWPSRSGGAEITENKRIAAAKLLHEKVNEILIINPNAHILIMGDFNDYPDDVSVRDALSAKTAVEDGLLINLMADLAAEKRGSYNYRGDWGFLDQIIISRAFANGKGLELIKGTTGPFYTNDMIYTNDKGEHSPNRTYRGDTYYGGYSDHLPVYTKIKLQK
jgi:predicted extracellular nuclease